MSPEVYILPLFITNTICWYLAFLDKIYSLYGKRWSIEHSIFGEISLFCGH